MKKISSTTELRNVILQLENRQVLQEQLLKEQFHATYRSLKPFNIIKSTIKEAVASHEIQENIIESVTNLAADFILKKISKADSENYLRNYFGKILHYGLTTIVATNSDKIRAIGEGFIESFFNTKKKEEKEN